MTDGRAMKRKGPNDNDMLAIRGVGVVSAAAQGNIEPKQMDCCTSELLAVCNGRFSMCICSPGTNAYPASVLACSGKIAVLRMSDCERATDSLVW